jgi:hypothetical protein
MKLQKHLLILTIILLGTFFLSSFTCSASGLSLSAVFLGEPDVFVPGVGLSAEISVTRSLGLFAGGVYVLSGTWGLTTGASWHPSRQFALYLQTLLLFDVIDGFVPQLGAGVRWSFPPTRSLSFFNVLSLNVPLASQFWQPEYGAGVSLRFYPTPHYISSRDRIKINQPRLPMSYRISYLCPFLPLAR